MEVALKILKAMTTQIIMSNETFINTEFSLSFFM